MTQFLLTLVGLYRRYVSPLTPASCRYEPCCSHYAELCITHRGPIVGSWLSLLRILRCNPLFSGGIDLPPLPPTVAIEPDYARIARLFDPHHPSPLRGAAAPQLPPGDLPIAGSRG